MEGESSYRCFSHLQNIQHIDSGREKRSLNLRGEERSKISISDFFPRGTEREPFSKEMFGCLCITTLFCGCCLPTGHVRWENCRGKSRERAGAADSGHRGQGEPAEVTQQLPPSKTQPPVTGDEPSEGRSFAVTELKGSLSFGGEQPRRHERGQRKTSRGRPPQASGRHLSSCLCQVPLPVFPLPQFYVRKEALGIPSAWPFSGGKQLTLMRSSGTESTGPKSSCASPPARKG